MFIEISIHNKQSYDNTLNLTHEQLAIVKEFVNEFGLDKNISSYHLEREICDHHLKISPNDFSDPDNKPNSREWFDKTYNSDERSDILYQLNMAKTTPFITGPVKFVVDMELWQSKWQWEYKVCRTVNVPVAYSSDDQVIDRLNGILTVVDRKLSTLGHIADKVGEMTFNQKCNVHMGGGLIMRVNRIKLLEDCCSDLLQEELNRGWRIIAATVQPDQRRPDYIMGMYDEGYNHDKQSAKR